MQITIANSPDEAFSFTASGLSASSTGDCLDLVAVRLAIHDGIPSGSAW
ncbi:hypothetical protein [Salinispora cortesiana]|nr:hypothetical protein [Salinispora cortesiana]